jgi:hypothetical protein
MPIVLVKFVVAVVVIIVVAATTFLPSIACSLIATSATFQMFERPNLFAICNNTFCEWLEG